MQHSCCFLPFRIIKICEVCQHPIILIIRKGKKPQESRINQHCKSKTSDKEEKALRDIEKNKVEKACPKCTKPLILRRSIYGQFWGCSGYPKCKYIEKLDAGKKNQK